jgi:hypothetical protein
MNLLEKDNLYKDDVSLVTNFFLNVKELILKNDIESIEIIILYLE